MAVASNIVFVWPGTNGTIPSGWTRETSLDSKYVLGANVSGDGGGTGGQGTHNHYVSSHTHTMTAGAAVNTTQVTLTVRGTVPVARVSHTHASSNSQASHPFSSNTNNDPLHVDIIYVKSDGTNDIADDMVVFFETGEAPASGWQFCDGNASSPDLRTSLLKGAATAADSNLTQSGSATHIHTADHIHTNFSSSTAVGRTFYVPVATPASVAGLSHTHLVNLTSSGADSNTSDGQPPYYELIPYQNQTGSDAKPEKIIGLWLSTNGSIPSDWTRVTSMDTNFVKAANTASSGGTGGSSQHTHTSSASHTHGYSAASGTATTCDGTMPAVPASTSGHQHTWTIGSATPTLENNTSQTNYPAYVKAIFIKYTPSGVTFTPKVMMF